MAYRNLSPVRLAAALLGLLLLTPAAQALVRTTIAVDGDTSDWSGVLYDPDNVLTDRSAAEGDLDLPSANRDLRTFAATWDDENLYLYFKRVSGSASVTYLAYVDVAAEGSLDAADLVLALKFNGAKAQGAEAYRYVPAGSPGDPITGDGVDEPGTIGVSLPTDLVGRATADGREIEARVSWAALGLAPGNALQFHASSARGTNLPSQVEDNAGPFSTRVHDLRLVSDGSQASSTPGSVLYPHLLSVTGNQADLANLSAVSPGGFGVEFWTDPDGNGDPSDGVRMALDGNGDGSFTGGGDALDPAFDRDRDGLPDTGSLAATTSFAFVLRVIVPPGVAPGSEDALVLAARSAGQPSLVVENIDVTVIGALSVSPDRSKLAVAGTEVWYPHRVCNFSGLTDSVTLSTTSSLGWPAQAWSDPNGDGNPTDGSPIASTGPIASGDCRSVVAVLQVPPGTPLGSVDVLVVRGVLASSPAIADDATDRTTTADRVLFAPDRAAATGAGGTVFYPATLTNAWFETGSFDLTVSSTLGSRVTVWSDPDGDGDPGDGRPINILGPVAPNGGTAHVVIEVRIPSAARPGDVDIAATEAALRGDPTVSATVRDTTSVRGVQVFEDPAFTRPATLFDLCGTIHALASGLERREKYRFVWYDSLGVLRRTSSVNGDFPDAAGQLSDSMALATSDPGGTWQVRLQQKVGGGFEDLAPGGFADFDVTDDSGGEGGVFTLLATDRTDYALSGDSLSSSSRLENPTTLTYRGGSLSYLLFRDSDQDGRPGAGESYITASGTATSWSPGQSTCGPFAVPDLGPGGRFTDSACSVSNIRFPASGAWRFCATWLSSCASEVAYACTVVSVGASPGCALNADAGPDRIVCDGLSTRLGAPAQPGLRYEWSPALFLDDPAAAQPLATPDFSIAYTLTVSDPLTGCVDRSTVQLTVSTPRRPDAGPNVRACSRGASVIGTDPGPGYRCDWLPVSGLSASTDCQPLAQPGRTTVYEVTWTDLATGCSDTDAMVFAVAPEPPADAGPDRFVCSTSSGAVIGSPAQPGYIYRWSPTSGLSDPNAAQPFARPAATTSYTLTVSEIATGCSNSDSVIVFSGGPIADAGGPGPVTAPVLLGSSCDPRLRYQWSPAAGLSDPTACNPIADPAVATTYCLTVTDRASGCPSAPSCIQVEPAPAPNCSAAQRPGPVQRLLAGKLVATPDDVGFRWLSEARSVQGYRGYAVGVKTSIPTATGGRLVFVTAPSIAATAGSDPGRVPGPPRELFFYQVVGVCQDGVTLGEM